MLRGAALLRAALSFCLIPPRTSTVCCSLSSIEGHAGVFGNDDAWIAGAIVRACHRLRDLPLEVVVCHYRSVNPQFKQRIDGALSAMLK